MSEAILEGDANPYSAPDAALDTGQDDLYQPKIFSFSGRIGRMRYLAYGIGRRNRPNGRRRRNVDDRYARNRGFLPRHFRDFDHVRQTSTKRSESQRLVVPAVPDSVSKPAIRDLHPLLPGYRWRQ